MRHRTHSQLPAASSWRRCGWYSRCSPAARRCTWSRSRPRGAPLHLERLVARGGPGARAFDRNLSYDTSSYGARAIDAMVRVVGIDQLVHGSDRPVVAPPAPPGPLGAAAWEAMTRTNPARLFAAQAQEVLAA